MPSKLKRAQRKSISPAMSSLSASDQSAQKKTRKDLVAKAKAKRAKPAAAKAKPKKKKVNTVGGVASALRGRGRL